MKKFSKSAALMAALVAATSLSTTSSYGATTLTANQKKQLQYLAEEEKLARDVYAYFSKNVTTQKFSNIVNSEQTHMNYVLDILKTYKISNPAASTKAGVFKDPTLQKLYNSLIAKGKVSVTAAFAAGVKVEETDINDLNRIIALKYPADVQAMLDSLLSGSQNHLRAFTR
jgi:hypothetical protein